MYKSKDGWDKCIALMLIIVTLPLLVVLMVLVKLSSPGPAIYRQRRIGQGGVEFTLLKLRSMREGPSEAMGALLTAPGGVEGTDRRTKLGRLLRATSLDELPQLFNVLRGDMSLVGPRPERPEYVNLFQSVPHYAERHMVKPGITGWAQIHGYRGQTAIYDRVVYDLHYIVNQSLVLDLRIMLGTVIEVMRCRG